MNQTNKLSTKIEYQLLKIKWLCAKVYFLLPL